MSRDEILEGIALGPEDSPRWEEAAALLEQAARGGKPARETSYMLAVCYKRLGKLADARAALRAVHPPDANVFLQLGLLSFREGEYADAEQEFARSLDTDPGSYPALYNVLLCRLCLGQFDRCLEVLPRLIALAPSPEAN